MSQKRINKLVKLICTRLGMTREQAMDFICNAAFEKQKDLPRVVLGAKDV